MREPNWLCWADTNAKGGKLVFVIDTNILFSFFRDNPVRAIILNADLLGIKLVSPEYALDELRNNKDALVKYAKVDRTEVEGLISILYSFIEIKPVSFFEEFREEAKRISPDQKDTPFFALALKLDAAIWSNEPRLKRQPKVNVFSTREMMAEFGVNP